MTKLGKSQEIAYSTKEKTHGKSPNTLDNNNTLSQLNYTQDDDTPENHKQSDILLENNSQSKPSGNAN